MDRDAWMKASIGVLAIAALVLAVIALRPLEGFAASDSAAAEAAQGPVDMDIDVEDYADAGDDAEDDDVEDYDDDKGVEDYDDGEGVEDYDDGEGVEDYDEDDSGAEDSEEENYDENDDENDDVDQYEDGVETFTLMEAASNLQDPPAGAVFSPAIPMSSRT